MERRLLIKQAIMALDGGTFQQLCDSYLFLKGYKNLHALGSQAGSRKTTKGTPDTYFYSEIADLYILVEYTTQRERINKKIEDDIKKCLTLSDEIRVGKIIYCHTSSNISIEFENKIRTKLKNENIELKLIGIDELTEDLFNNYPWLVREYLGIAIDSNQILCLDNFLDLYNKGASVAPLVKEVLGRERELLELEESFEKNNCIIITGEAGVGKTQLALSFANKFANDNGYKLYCFFPINQLIEEDLAYYFDQPGKYILVLDDVNEIPYWETIIKFIISKNDSFQFKILITVRKYAYEQFNDKINKWLISKKLNLRSLRDEEVITLLQSRLNIPDLYAITQIIELAKGNARIAMIGGLLLKQVGLEDIQTLESLISSYYTSFMPSCFDSDDTLIVAASVAYYKVLNLDRIDNVTLISDNLSISIERIKEIIQILVNNEILDKYSTFVKYSDQCLANYILKYAIIDREVINLNNLIENFYFTSKDPLIVVIKLLLNNFNTVDIRNRVFCSVKTVYKKLIKRFDTNREELKSYILMFSSIIYNEALLYVKKQIDIHCEENVELNLAELGNYRQIERIDLDLLKILGSLVDNSEIFENVIELFVLAFSKYPSFYPSFYHFCIRYFVNSENYKDLVIKRKAFLLKIEKQSEGWNNYNFTVLYLDIFIEFIRPESRFNRLVTPSLITSESISLSLDSYTEEFRNIMWENLKRICQVFNEKEGVMIKVNKILSESFSYSLNKYNDFLIFDFKYIKEILEGWFPLNCYDNCQLVYFMHKHLNLIGMNLIDNTNEYFNTRQFSLFTLFNPIIETTIRNIDKNKELIKTNIIKFISVEGTAGIEEFLLFINGIQLRSNNSLISNLIILFEVVYEFKPEIYREVVKLYLELGTPLNVHPKYIIQKFIEQYGEKETWDLISSMEYKDRGNWKFYFFELLPSNSINEVYLENLYQYLKGNEDLKCMHLYYRDLSMLKKFINIDKNIFDNVCQIVLSMLENNDIWLECYFSIFFNNLEKNFPNSIEELNLKSDILIGLFFRMLKVDSNFDNEGIIFKYILNIEPNFINQFIQYFKTEFIELTGYRRYNDDSLGVFFDYLLETGEYLNVISELFDEILLETNMFFHKAVDLFAFILRGSRACNKLEASKVEFLKYYIKINNNDVEKMRAIFSALYDFDDNVRILFFKEFLRYNNELETFRIILQRPSIYTYNTYNIIHKYENRIEMLKNLRDSQELRGLSFIQHRVCIDDEISMYEGMIDEERRDQFINSAL
ncbi:AAA family ATPase [Veillonella intestinalis]|uniref:nSTAND3 domain-containing NTPase n=1 Tax=Veillonella intestinalis TaxID=2941341 RepID=UPI00203C4DDC|nr:AAA family ATPase [Veillonella intestinalis]